MQDTLAAENHPGLELVIPKSPVEIVDANEFLQVPVMTGSVRDEGSLVVGRECPLKISVSFSLVCDYRSCCFRCYYYFCVMHVVNGHCHYFDYHYFYFRQLYLFVIVIAITDLFLLFLSLSCFVIIVSM